ncbi:MAG: lysine 2,3-aminomutase [Chlorobium sp.]|nr:lysine 2,3-aminomutase [Chlorobiaceae bacterium]MCF8216918.1 lysine 2,3-aminomutase [Chlorobium sp.]MCF8271756.1 lysine 2,3-aminomutase [Chlorobium sp.]MCF8288135.1 lysine 2,3-aminomutase [Chlorobium sp.]MCF8291735.1 lysine 2,3-aminomutase [Chlorobium sp.]
MSFVMKYCAYTSETLHKLPQLSEMTDEQVEAIRIVAAVYPFRVNSHVVENLIDWSNIPDDPMFRLSFPQAGMLDKADYVRIADLMRNDADPVVIRDTAKEIQMRMNPNPAGQMQMNTPVLDDEQLHGMQHKYRESVLFFPSEAQVCHAYCTYCFRWPQFSGLEEMKFANDNIMQLVAYVRSRPEVTDIIFTGGDPMVMSTESLRKYVAPLLEIPTLKAIRFGTKAISWWPYRFTSDPDADELVRLFSEITASGKHLAIMAHISHPREIERPEARQAVERIRSTGAVIRSQSPVVRHVNDDADTWRCLWQKQVQMGIIPYYMFLERDTGPKQYFEVPLVEALGIFNSAYSSISGLGRTVRGPSMSCLPGKVIVEDVTEINREKVFVLKFTQGRNPTWTNRTFFAEFDESATWIDELSPAFGRDEFFFEREMSRFTDN